MNDGAAHKAMVVRAGGKAKAEALPERVRVRWILEAMLERASGAQAEQIKAEIAKTWS
jgi:hypothetical protein